MVIAGSLLILLSVRLFLPTVFAADFTSTWNSTTGNWSDATKWNTNPTFPNNGVNTYDAIQNGGTLTVNQAIDIDGFTLNGGTLNGSDTLTLSGSMTWSGGNMTGSGTTNANGGVSFSGGTKQLSGRVLNIGDGVGGGVTASWTAGTIDMRDSGILNNKSDSTFTTNFDGTMELGNHPATFNNEGTFTKNGGTGTTTIGIGGSNAFAFNNSGTVNVDTGTLTIAGVGTSTGAWNVADGTTLNFGIGNGTRSLNAGTSVSVPGTGVVQFSGGTTSFNSGTYNVAGTTQVNGGTVNFNAAASTGQLTVSSGTLGGTGMLTVSGLTTFSGGTMSGSGTVNADGGATLSGGTKNINGRVLNLAGSSTWTGGQINVGNNGQLVVLTGATLDTSIAANITNGFSATNGTFTVQGTFNKNGGTTVGLGTGSGSFTFSNTGVVNVSGGTLSIDAAFTQHSGSTLTAGTWNVSNGASINRSTGSNITTIGSAASVTLDGAGSSFAKVTTALATNQGSFTLRNNRDLTTAGNYANSGTTTVEDAGTVMTIGGASIYTQTSGGTLLNEGGLVVASAMNLSGGFIRLTNTDVPTSQPLTLSGTASFEGVGSSSWAGTITVSNSVFNITSGTTVLTGQITGTGGITKQGAGTLELADLPALPNNFTGQVIVEAGSLVLNRSAPDTSIPESSLSPVIVQTGGTLLLAQNDQIGDTRGLNLQGGTFATGGNDEVLGSLTLTSSSVIDLGAGASLLAFANSTGNLWTGTLSIWNWSGIPVTGGGIDQLLFGPGGLTLAQASQISFYSGTNSGFIGFGGLLGSGEVVPNGIVPVPEPSAMLSLGFLFSLIGWRERGLVMRRRG